MGSDGTRKWASLAFAVPGRYYTDIRQTVPASDQEMNSVLAELSRVRPPLHGSRLYRRPCHLYTYDLSGRGHTLSLLLKKASPASISVTEQGSRFDNCHLILSSQALVRLQPLLGLLNGWDSALGLFSLPGPSCPLFRRVAPSAHMRTSGTMDSVPQVVKGHPHYQQQLCFWGTAVPSPSWGCPAASALLSREGS